MLSAWVVTGLSEPLDCVDDMDMMLPRLRGWALGSAGMPPPAAALGRALSVNSWRAASNEVCTKWRGTECSTGFGEN